MTDEPRGLDRGLTHHGDRVRLPIETKRINPPVDSIEIVRRLGGHRPPPAPARGGKALHRRAVAQAPEGCDFDALAGHPAMHDAFGPTPGASVPADAGHGERRATVPPPL